MALSNLLMNLPKKTEILLKKRETLQLKIDDWYKKKSKNKWARRI